MLVGDLAGTSPATLYGGQLTKRLSDLELSSVPPAAQYRLGIAVGRRANTGTVVVQREGVFPCAKSGDVDQWPIKYRLGLVEGMFLSEDGQLQIAATLPKYGVHALNAPGIDVASARELLSRIENAPTALALALLR